MGRDLHFARELKQEGRLGLWRWFLGAWGIGTYREHDSVDVQYELDGRPMVAEGLRARAEARVAPVSRRIALALAAGLVLADSSIVTLALPEILRELDTTVAEVAWVLVSFNVALAVAAVPGRDDRAAHPAHRDDRRGPRVRRRVPRLRGGERAQHCSSPGASCRASRAPSWSRRRSSCCCASTPRARSARGRRPA